jgi:hypothetical protein
MVLVHIRALECLNNLFLSLGLNTESVTLSPNDSEAAASVWEELWSILYDVGYRSEQGQEQRFEMWISAIGALWGVARVCKTRLVCYILVAVNTITERFFRSLKSPKYNY